MQTITTKQEKDKTTIIVPRRLKKDELERVVSLLSSSRRKKPKRMTAKRIQEVADEVTSAAWEKLKKKRKFSWL